jgi:hypothetical protein
MLKAGSADTRCMTRAGFLSICTALFLLAAMALPADDPPAGAADLSPRPEAPPSQPPGFPGTWPTAPRKPAQPQAQEWNGFTIAEADVLAFYGKPGAKNMGLLGRYTKEELAVMLEDLAAEYEKAGGKPVKRAFYIIYGTVWPKGEIGIINQDVLKNWVEFALAHDMLVFIDHQIGKYDPVASLEKMLPWLQYPNVHLALDPEWHTSTPMSNIGQVSADEINRAQQAMEDYLEANSLAGERLLLIHQFKPWMVSERPSIRTDFSSVRLVHCADGFGNPYQKRAASVDNATADHCPI